MGFPDLCSFPIGARHALEYRELKREPIEIRVLEIHPALQLTAPLHCTLRHLELANARYSALSYVWGQSDEDQVVIKVNYERKKYIKKIGIRLARALRQFRRRRERVTVWADALCINQAGDKIAKAERSWQVNHMKLIYRQAREVNAWLGPHVDLPREAKFEWSIEALFPKPHVRHEGETSIDTAFSVAKAIWCQALTMQTHYTGRTKLPSTEEDWLKVCLTVANSGSTNFVSSSQQAHRWVQFATALRDAAVSDIQVQQQLPALVEFSRVSYFSRIWTLQEAGRARSLTFHYGKQQIPHIPLFLALSVAIFFRSSQNHPEQKAHFMKLDVRFMRYLEARVTCTEHTSVRKVFELAYYSLPPLHNATDLRDLVYARLGLASDEPGVKDGLRADYDLSTAEAYTATTEFLLAQGFTDLLVTFRPYGFMDVRPVENPRVERSSEKELPTGSLPSWAYDWSRNGFSTFNNYNASGNTRPRIEYIPYPGAKVGRAITISGCDVGTVEELGEMFSELVEEGAGFTKNAVFDCTLKKDPDCVPTERSDLLVGKIKDHHAQLGLHASEASIDSLFSDHQIDVPKFWCWWLLWVRSVLKLRQQRRREEPEDLSELLFRGPSSSQATTSRVISTEKLLDLDLWLSLLFPHNEAQAPGTELAEACFRSAWGMRVAVLNTGHLCYLPELSGKNDQVVIFHGVKAPLVLRQMNDGRAQRIIGPARVLGMMSGELLQTDPPSHTFTLV